MMLYSEWRQIQARYNNLAPECGLHTLYLYIILSHEYTEVYENDRERDLRRLPSASSSSSKAWPQPPSSRSPSAATLYESGWPSPSASFLPSELGKDAPEDATGIGVEDGAGPVCQDILTFPTDGIFDPLARA